MANIYIGLDLSTACSGYSVFYGKELVYHGSIKPKASLDVIDRIEYMAREFNILFIEIKKKYPNASYVCIIENIFLAFFKGKNQVTGFANLGRISGAIMSCLFFFLGISAKDIILRNANVARPMVGLKGTCQKAQVQCWVLKTIFGKDTSDYDGLIEAVVAKKLVGEVDQKIFKKRMDEISKIIEKDTGYGEDVSDALLLGYSEAYK